MSASFDAPSLRRLSEICSDLLCVASPDGRFVHLNRAWTRLLGHSLDELKGRPFIEFVHIEDRAATVEAFDFLRNGTKVFGFKNRYQCADGTYRHLTWNSAYSEEDGLFYAVARDDSALDAAQDELRRTREFLDSIIENVPNMVFLKDRQHRHLLLNRAGEDVLGRSRASVIGRSNAELFIKEHADLYSDDDRRVLEAGETVDVPSEPMQTPHRGLRYIRVRKVPLHGASGKPEYVLGIAEDITERKRTEEELQQTYDQLRQQQAFRLRLINAVAHDLASPLTPIEVQLYLLQQSAAPTDQALEIVRRNVDQLKRLVADLKDFARMESGRLGLQRAPGTVSKVLHEAVESFQTYARQRGLALSCSDDLPEETLPFDPNRITQVLYNLITNAMKFTPRGGSIQLGADHHENEVWVHVRDTGRGIESGEIQRLFQPFSQLRTEDQTKHNGMGLGLFISKGIIEAHGGRIWCESPGRDQGATFSFALAGEAAGAPAPAAAA